MLRPVRTVHATTKGEIDAALATADQVSVEGDDELLSYAVAKASKDPENSIAVQVDGQQWSTVEPNLPPRSRRRMWTIIGFGSVLLAVLLGLGICAYVSVLYRDVVYGGVVINPRSAGEIPGRVVVVRPGPPSELRAPTEVPSLEDLIAAQKARPQPPSAQLMTPQQSPPLVPLPAPPRGAALENGFWSNLPSLLWPLATIVAIIALFLIARLAVSSGRNVEITWKVTEKMQGRVVMKRCWRPSVSLRRPVISLR
jgi:hypothetical protein